MKHDFANVQLRIQPKMMSVEEWRGSASDAYARHSQGLKLLVGDAGAAAISALLIAPSVTLIDR